MNRENVNVHGAQHLQPWASDKSIRQSRHHPPIALYFKPIHWLLCAYHPLGPTARYPTDLHEADGFLWRWGRMSVLTNHQVRCFHPDKSKILRKTFMPKISLSIYKNKNKSPSWMRGMSCHKTFLHLATYYYQEIFFF